MILLRGFLALLLTFSAAQVRAQVFGSPDLLEPEKAFRISARALDEPPLDEVRQILDRASPKR